MKYYTLEDFGGNIRLTVLRKRAAKKLVKMMWAGELTELPIMGMCTKRDFDKPEYKKLAFVW